MSGVVYSLNIIIFINNILEGTDIPVSRGTFTDTEVIIDGLDDEWRILENGFPQNYTKYKKFQEEAKKKGTDKVRQGIDER